MKKVCRCSLVSGFRYLLPIQADGLTRSRVFGFIWLGSSGALEWDDDLYGPCPTCFCARSRPACIRSPVVALDREISLGLKTHTKYSMVPSKLFHIGTTLHGLFPHPGADIQYSRSHRMDICLVANHPMALYVLFLMYLSRTFLHVPACLSPTLSTSLIPRYAIPRDTIIPPKTHHIPACSFVRKFPSPDCSSPPQISRDSSVVVTLIWGSQGRTRYVSVSMPLPPPYLNPFRSPLTAWVTKQIPLWIHSSCDPPRPSPSPSPPSPLQIPDVDSRCLTLAHRTDPRIQDSKPRHGTRQP